MKDPAMLWLTILRPPPFNPGILRYAQNDNKDYIINLAKILKKEKAFS